MTYDVWRLSMKFVKKEKIKKVQTCYLFPSTTRDKLRIISEKEGLPMSVILEQLIEGAYDRGKYGN